MNKHLIFIAGVASVFIFLYAISSQRIMIPIPVDSDHGNITTEVACLDCHGEGKEYARAADHVQKDQCFKCHKRTENVSLKNDK